jgi:integrase
MRTSAWREFPELPDRVLRAIAAKAPNTRNSIRACYGVWRAWYAAQTPTCEPFQAEPREIAQFLQDNGPPISVSRNGDFEVSREGFTSSGTPAKTYATLQRYLAVLGKLHLEAGLPDPTKDPEFVAMWRVLRRGLSRPKQKAALGLDAIRKAVALLPPTVIGKRNRALLLLAYALMARRSELVALNVEDFEIHEDESATVTFEWIKTGETSARPDTRFSPART